MSSISRVAVFWGGGDGAVDFFTLFLFVGSLAEAEKCLPLCLHSHVFANTSSG